MRREEEFPLFRYSVENTVNKVMKFIQDRCEEICCPIPREDPRKEECVKECNRKVLNLLLRELERRLRELES